MLTKTLIESLYEELGRDSYGRIYRRIAKVAKELDIKYDPFDEQYNPGCNGGVGWCDGR